MDSFAPMTTPPASSPLPNSWQIPAAIRGRLGREAGSQRAIFEEGHLLLILHEPPAPDMVGRIPAFFWRQPTGEWKTHRSTMQSGTLADFLANYEKPILELESRENTASKAADFHDILEATAPLLRAIRQFHRAIQNARELVKEDRELINYRDRAAGLERTGELLLQDAQFGLNYIVARQAEAQSENARRMSATAHRLNILAALFLPLTAVASVLAMDVKSRIPNTFENFWFIVGGSLGLGLLIAFAIRKKG